MISPSGTPSGADRGHVELLSLLARLQSALRDHDRIAIVEIVSALVALRPTMGEQWASLARVAASNGEVTLAREAMEIYLQESPGNPAAPNKKVILLTILGAWDEALDLMRRLPEDVPDRAAYAYTRGTAALYVGETGEAREYLEIAIRLRPDAGSPWLALSGLVDFAEEPLLMDRLVAAQEAIEKATPTERSAYQYALSKAWADNEEHARACAAVSRGAKLIKRNLDYGREEDTFTARDAIAGYDADKIAAIARQQTWPTERAMFVMGLPRSGTTLVEQILTSHSAVADGGEIYRLPLLVKDIGGLSCSAVETYVARTGAQAAAQLWSHWLNERFPSPGRVVDKSLNTSRVLGLTATLLPDAPLVWMTRDPLDSAWSCFRRRFAGEARWSFDLEDIAFHFRLEDQLLARWREILGNRLLVVPYEELVTKPEIWTRRILAHCGLPEEPQVFTPHENSRTVTTSSVMQVRRPIYRDAIGSAEAYRQFLEPFSKAYFE